MHAYTHTRVRTCTWGNMSKASHVGSRPRVLRLMFTHGTHFWAADPSVCACVMWMLASGRELHARSLGLLRCASIGA